MPQAWSSRTLVSLGANLGDAKQTIENAALTMLRHFGQGSLSFSRLYRAAAVGGPAGQDDFFNAVAIIESNQTAFEILQFLQQTEQALGRNRLKRWEARRIDLDVLLHESKSEKYGLWRQHVIWTPTFKVPHPRMSMRTFVLKPACDIAPDWVEPVTGQSLQGLSGRLDRIAAERRLPTVLLSCDAPSMIESFARAIIESVPHVSLTSDGAPAVFRDGQPWIVFCLVPRLYLGVSDELSGRTDRKYESVHASVVSQIRQMKSSHASLQFDHWMHACQSPDPSISHWEDFCRPWADALGMTGRIARMHLADQFRQTGLLRNAPPYLLAADDIAWAAHEIIAATEAMSCAIQPCESNLWSDRLKDEK